MSCRGGAGFAIAGLAGAAGTATMDVVWYLRYRRGGGDQALFDWGTAKGLEDWDNAPAPGQLARRLIEGVSGRPLPGRAARPVTSIIHWVYGSGWACIYHLSARSRKRAPLVQGAALGTVVWLTSYVVLPPTGIYRPMWEYDSRTLWKDLSAHLAYGAGTVLTYRLLARAG